MAGSEKQFIEPDEKRLCPVCRMPISILATRCRHCGEEVARPRREEEVLTVKDLGGESHTTYTLSGDVIDALETFRAEELTAQEIERRKREAESRWFAGRHSARESDTTSPAAKSILPELDDRHRDLADMGLGGTSTPMPGKRRMSRGEVQRKVYIAGGVMVGLVLLYLAIDVVSGPIQEYLSQRNAPEEIVYVNQALEMLEAGRPTIEAFEEAIEAIAFNPTEENRQIADEVRQRFCAEIEEILAAVPWRRDHLNRASSLMNRALRKDSSKEIRDLFDRVNMEIDAFKFVFMRLDDESGKALFKLNNPRYPSNQQDVLVGVGDYLQERFLVRSISPNLVRLEDTKVMGPSGYRKLAASRISSVSGES
jgi:ribosomal protein L40E